jgi:hypothetical protein
LVARPSSEILCPADILLFVSPVYVFGHCPPCTEKHCQPYLVGKLKSSFSTELGRVELENATHDPRLGPRPARGHGPAPYFTPPFAPSDSPLPLPPDSPLLDALCSAPPSSPPQLSTGGRAGAGAAASPEFVHRPRSSRRTASWRRLDEEEQDTYW